MSALDARLRRLAVVSRKPEGCDGCRYWGPAAAVFLDRPLRPEVCPGCGRRVPIRLVREYAIERGRV